MGSLDGQTRGERPGGANSKPYQTSIGLTWGQSQKLFDVGQGGVPGKPIQQTRRQPNARALTMVETPGGGATPKRRALSGLKDLRKEQTVHGQTPEKCPPLPGYTGFLIISTRLHRFSYHGTARLHRFSYQTPNAKQKITHDAFFYTECQQCKNPCLHFLKTASSGYLTAA